MPPVGEGESETEQSAERHAVDHDGDEQAETRLHRPADEFGLLFFGHRHAVASFCDSAFSSSICVLESDGAIDLRFAVDFQEAERQQARDDADEHAADEKRPDHWR